MSGYLLDTTAISVYYNEDHVHYGRIRATIDALPSASLKLVSVVTLGEIEFGIRLAEQQAAQTLPQMRERLERIRQHGRLQITHHTSEVYAELRAKLAARVSIARKARPRWLEEWMDAATGRQLQIDENDLWICAQARERDLTLVTLDGDFQIFASVDPQVRIQPLAD